MLVQEENEKDNENEYERTEVLYAAARRELLWSQVGQGLRPALCILAELFRNKNELRLTG